jgi:hypothetical protein
MYKYAVPMVSSFDRLRYFMVACSLKTGRHRIYVIYYFLCHSSPHKEIVREFFSSFIHIKVSLNDILLGSVE